MKKENVIFCQLCSGVFDSNDTYCQTCEFYKVGLKKYGITKTNEMCQVDILEREFENIKRFMKKS